MATVVCNAPQKSNHDGCLCGQRLAGSTGQCTVSPPVPSCVGTRSTDGALCRRAGACPVSSAALCAEIDWPRVRQGVRRTCERYVFTKQHTTQEVTYGLLTRSPAQIRLEAVEQAWRGYWSIENQVQNMCAMYVGGKTRANCGWATSRGPWRPCARAC